MCIHVPTSYHKGWYVCIHGMFVLQACRAKGVDCIVAPYEADAQLAYLSRTGAAQIVITEDSDLILFGCEKVRLAVTPRSLHTQ